MNLYPNTDGVTVEGLFDLDAAYDDYVRTLPRENRQGVFHPSAVGMCRRSIYYEYVRAPSAKTLTPDVEEVFELGHHIHVLVQNRLDGILRKWFETDTANHKGFWRREVPYNDPAVRQHWLYDDLGIAGTTDYLLCLESPRLKQRSVVEIKSIGESSFLELKGPKREHLMQAHLYGIRFEASSGYIFYFEKNKSRRKIYPYVFDPKIADEAVSWFAGVLAKVPDMVEPDREESWFGCKGCSYAHLCQPEILKRRAQGARAHKARTTALRRRR